MSHDFLKFSAIGVSALAATLALCFAILAWQSPTAAPPADNADAPINTGPNSQIKAGDLGFKNGTNDPYHIHMDGASFSLKNNSGSERFIVDQDGHVGIGTTSPAKALEVVGDTKSGAFCLDDQCCSTWEECANFVGAGGISGKVQNPIYGGVCAWDQTAVISSGCCPKNTCALMISGGVCYPDGWIMALPALGGAGSLQEDYGGRLSSLPEGNVVVCRAGYWRAAPYYTTVGSAYDCYPNQGILGNELACDKGTCNGYKCVYKTCNRDSDCAGAIAAGSKCDKGICCVNGSCNVGGRCLTGIYVHGVQLEKCVSGVMQPMNCVFTGLCPDGFSCNPATSLCEHP